MQNNTPLQFLISGAESHPDANAVRMNGEELSYKEFLATVHEWAGYFKHLGIRPRSKVALYSDNDFDIAISIFALWHIDAICIPMNINQKPDKLRQIEGIVDPDFGVYSRGYKVTGHYHFPMEMLTGERGLTCRLTPPLPQEIGMIMLTSGTSGVPKAVPMTHASLWHNARETADRLKISPEDRIFINTPLYTTSSIIHLLTMLARGSSLVLERGFLFGSSILDQIDDFACTGFGGVPVHFFRMAASLGESAAPPTLRFLMNSGDHLPVSLIHEIRRGMPSVKLFCAYGLTEVAGRLCILDPAMLGQKTGSVGRPLKGMSVTVRDDAGSVVGPNIEGEIFVTGCCLMDGYLNNPEANIASMKSQGFATGDYGYIDSQGYLFLKGRRDDILKVGGEKVSLKMIEEAIVGFDDFADFMVAPFNDDHMGNIPCLYYVLKEGGEFNRRNLLKHLKTILPGTHIPPKFVEVPEIPRTSSGKAIRS